MTRMWGRLVAVVGVVGLVVASAIATRSASVTERGGATPSASVTDRAAVAPVFAPEQLYGGGKYWEPTVVSDPSSNYIYMAATLLPGWHITLRVSSDGGASWGPVINPPCVCAWQADPVIAVSNTGTLYLLYMNRFRPGTSLMRSTNHGATWTDPVVVENTLQAFNDKPWMVISPDGQDVYVTYNNSERCCSLIHQYVSVSHDGGKTFGVPIRTSGSITTAWYVWGGAMAPDGTVYFAESASDELHGYRGSAYLVRSSDEGATWTRTKMGTSLPPPNGSAHSAPDASVAVDSAGTVMFAYTSAATSGGSKALLVRTSNDGVTWSAPSTVSALGDAGYEVLAAGPAPGDFRLAWMDDRAGGSFPWNTWFVRTTDSGATWSAPVRLSDVGSGAAYKSSNGYLHPGGDYMGLAVTSSGANVAAWGESTKYAVSGYAGGVWYTKGG